MFDVLMSCFQHRVRSPCHRAPEGTGRQGSLPILLQTEGRTSYIEEATFCNTVTDPVRWQGVNGVHLVCASCHSPVPAVCWLRPLVTTNHLLPVCHICSYKIDPSSFSCKIDWFTSAQRLLFPPPCTFSDFHDGLLHSFPLLLWMQS